MTIDPVLITRKMALISADVPEILRLAGLDVADYLNDVHAEVLAERYLERTIGRMIDINFHLIVGSGRPPPRDYYDSFLQLVDIGVLGLDFAKALAGCAGLRNRIAHEYDEIDPVKIHAGLRSAASDIPKFLKQVNRFLGAVQAQGSP
jgi:uncharacterized protein YutE (UPF0331/DUF86 family)